MKKSLIKKLASALLSMTLITGMMPAYAFADALPQAGEGQAGTGTQTTQPAEPEVKDTIDVAVSESNIDISDGICTMTVGGQEVKYKVGNNFTLTGTANHCIYINHSNAEAAEFNITLQDLKLSFLEGEGSSGIYINSVGDSTLVNFKVKGECDIRGRDFAAIDKFHKKNKCDIHFDVEEGASINLDNDLANNESINAFSPGFGVSLSENTMVRAEEPDYVPDGKEGIVLINKADRLISDGKGNHHKEGSDVSEPCVQGPYKDLGDGTHCAKCEKCGYVVKSAEPHDFTKDPRQTEDQNHHYATCSKCGVRSSEPIECIPGGIGVSAGGHFYNCKVCGQMIKSTFVHHDYEFQSVIDEPDESGYGIAEYKCETCGKENFLFFSADESKKVLNIDMPDPYDIKLLRLNDEEVYSSHIAFGTDDKLVLVAEKGKMNYYGESVCVIDSKTKEVCEYIDIPKDPISEQILYTNMEKEDFADLTELEKLIDSIPLNLGSYDPYRVRSLKDVLAEAEKYDKYYTKAKQPEIDAMTAKLEKAIALLDKPAGNLEEKKLTMSGEDVINITETGYSINEGTEIPFTGKYEITGTGKQVNVSGKVQIITVNDLTLVGANDCFAIAPDTEATMILKGKSSFTADEGYAGTYVNEDATLNIKGDGELSSVALWSAAGIGGSDETGDNPGNINIYSGKIHAESKGSDGAGIGGAESGDAGHIKIFGGDITAISDDDGAAIGSGEDEDGGTIDIYGGKIYAESGGDGAAIGCGYDNAELEHLNIYGGDITAICTGDGAAIGCGDSSDDPTPINITGGVFHLESEDGSAIGGGNGDDDCLIKIKNAVIFVKNTETVLGANNSYGGKDDNFLEMDNVTIIAENCDEIFGTEPVDFNGKPVCERTFEVKDREDGLADIQTSDDEFIPTYVKDNTVKIYMSEERSKDLTVKAVFNPGERPEPEPEYYPDLEEPEINVPADTEVKGNEVSSEVKGDVLDKKAEDAAKNPEKDVVIEVKPAPDKGDAQKPEEEKTEVRVTVTLPAENAEKLAESTKASVEIKTPAGSVKFSNEAFKDLTEDVKGSEIKIIVEKQKSSKGVHEIFGENAAITHVKVIADGREIHKFGGFGLTLTFDVPENLIGKKLAALHIRKDGRLEKLAGNLVSKDGKQYVDVNVKHLSEFALVEESAADEAIKAQAEKDEKIKAGVKKTKLNAKSELVKGGIRVTWKKTPGYRMDGYEVQRSTKRYSGYKDFFDTEKTAYKNTKALKKGTRYFYRVRGYRMVGDEKVYTGWSLKAFRKYK